jgi:hypothetical protein
MIFSIVNLLSTGGFNQSEILLKHCFRKVTPERTQHEQSIVFRMQFANNESSSRARVAGRQWLG